MDSKNLVEIENESTEKLIMYQSAMDDSNINLERAENLANILRFDKNTYNDINIETVIKACELAGIISYQKSRTKKVKVKNLPKWELEKKSK